MPRRRKYTDEQVVLILKEAAAGAKTDEICRKYGVSQNTFYAWRTKFAGMTVPDIKKMRTLEDENRKLKHMVADQALEIRAIKELLTKNF
jgi:putative transposase